MTPALMKTQTRIQQEDVKGQGRCHVNSARDRSVPPRAEGIWGYLRLEGAQKDLPCSLQRQRSPTDDPLLSDFKPPGRRDKNVLS